MLEEEDQMCFFEIAGMAPERVVQELSAPPAAAKPAPAPARTPQQAAPPARLVRKKTKPAVVVPAPVPKKVSGLVPEGDVRLTANIRQDLHLKLKIASAHRRTTIGEIIEELIAVHL